MKKKNSKLVKKKKTAVEDKDVLDKLLLQYKNVLSYSSSRVSRLLDLLSRDSTKKLPKEKKERLIKRHLAAEEELSFAMSTVDRVEDELSNEKK